MTIDPSLKVTYKNYYFDDDHKSDSGYNLDEWVHGLVADFDSGYVNDMVGAVVTAGFVSPLSVKKGTENGKGIGITNTERGSDGKANGIAGFQQAYVKTRYTFDQVELKADIGVKNRSLEQYGDNGSRLLSSSTNGIDLAVNVAGLGLYATQIDGFSARNDSKFSSDLTNGTDKIDNVRIFGATYSVAGVGLTAETAASTDYLTKNFFKAGYTFDLDNSMAVAVDGRYGTAKENGKLYGNANYKSKYYNLNAKLNVGNVWVSAGYNRTSDGDYDNKLFKESHGAFNSSLSQWEGFMLEDETAYVVSAGYNFADQGMPGLDAKVWYAKGSSAKDLNDFSRKEYGSFISYAFDGQFKGLKVSWLYDNYRADGTPTGARGTTKPGTLYDEDTNRFYVTYDFTVF
nr:OprD family outer membrane porin [Endozoicomonas sp. OPT23]